MYLSIHQFERRKLIKRSEASSILHGNWAGYFTDLLSLALLNSAALTASATDSNEYESGSDEAVSPENGLMYTGGGTWIQGTDGRWWYRHADGTYTTSDWEYINGKWYYFDADGWMVTGWLQLGNTWYYLLPSSGEMVTGWKYIGNYWYYFESNGAMVTGWKWLTYGSYNNGDPYWNYFNDSGEFVTDSDVHGCGSGFNTYLDHKHLKGTSLNYHIDSECTYVSQINSAAYYWNNISNHVVSLIRNTSGIQPIDIEIYNDSSIDGYGLTKHINSNGNVISPMNSNWKKCEIALKNNNSNALATICHEFGHALGLSHRFTKTDSIMHIFHETRAVSIPQQCDINVINHLY